MAAPRQPRAPQRHLSVVIPAYNEADSLPQLLREVKAICRKLKFNYQAILINDGSTDDTQTVMESLHRADPKHVKVVQFMSNYGKAAALHAGFQHAKDSGDYVLTLDADLQDDPSELPKLLAKLEEGYDVASGWKEHRKDSFIKNNTSKVYNAATNRLTNLKLHDHNSGYKLYRTPAVKNLSLYGELHRYIPALLSAQGHKIGEVKVEHRKLIHGKTKYGPGRFVKGMLDLLTVVFITRFKYRPLHFFGYIGLASLVLGSVIGAYLVGYKFIAHQSIGERPLLLLAVLLVVVGVQITVTGFISEQVTALNQERQPSYKIKQILEA